MRFVAQFQLCSDHLNFRNRLLCRPVNVKLCQRFICQLKAIVHPNFFQGLVDLLLFDRAALDDTNGFRIRAVVNLLLTQNKAFISVLDFNICHHRVFATAIAARENTRCCHGQSHHTSALQEITTSHISHFLTPHKLFCFFLFSSAHLHRGRLVCCN